MYPRLKLLKELLRNDGVIFITIDDNELYNLKFIMDEIFGSQNFVANYIWEARSGKGATATNVVNAHEYVLCYCKNNNDVILQKDVRIKKGGIYDDERGFYGREQLRQWGQETSEEDRRTMAFPIKAPDGSLVRPIKDDGSKGRWRVGEDTAKKLLEIKDLDFVLDVFMA
jgi:adenine-specific DNA-methyltransferase